MSTSSYHHGDLRNALVSAAIEVAGESDARDVSLREVARRAGVSHAAAYNHFTDKTGLLRAVAVRGFEAMREELATATDDPGSTVEDLAAAYMRFAFRHRVEFRLMYDRALCLPEGEPDILADLGLEAQAAVGEFLGARYAIAPDAMALASLAAWGQAHGIATLILETPALKGVDEPTAEHLARQSAGMLALTPR